MDYKTLQDNLEKIRNTQFEREKERKYKLWQDYYEEYLKYMYNNIISPNYNMKYETFVLLAYETTNYKMNKRTSLSL